MIMLLSQVGSVVEDEIPALVYQLLLLATKGHKGLVVKGIVRAIAKIDELVRSAQQPLCSRH